MKNTGLKMPEKDQVYVLVGFSYYERVKIIGKSFIILCFKVNTWVDTCKKLEETVHLPERHLCKDPTFDLVVAKLGVRLICKCCL